MTTSCPSRGRHRRQGADAIHRVSIGVGGSPGGACPKWAHRDQAKPARLLAGSPVSRRRTAPTHRESKRVRRWAERPLGSKSARRTPYLRGHALHGSSIEAAEDVPVRPPMPLPDSIHKHLVGVVVVVPVRP